MCGIVGMALVTPPVSRELIEQMRDTMMHRGPDGAGVWCSADGRVALGHRRLAIIDLTEGGHQPMVREGGAVAITFNGEIYNFADLRAELAALGVLFNTQSDTEVLLAAYLFWGDECLERLNGMFAFAIYDGRRQTLLLARDRAGEKPLFVRHARGRFTFASELKALMADPAAPRVIDRAALDEYLGFGYVSGTACLVEGVSKLAPGEALRYDLSRDTVTKWRYWDLPASFVQHAVDDEALLDELESLLTDAVRRQLVADVPVGVLLSGGVDSSLVTAAAARTSSQPLRTFTISFPGHGTFDEAPYARLVASHFGTRHTELVAEPATVDLLPILARQYCEPIADSSMVPSYLVSRLIREQCTVALGGDGGDELFGGYQLYQVLQLQQRLRRWMPSPVRSVLAAAAGQLPMGFRGRGYVQSVTLDRLDAVARMGSYFDPKTRGRLAPSLRELRAPRAEQHRRTLAAKGTTVLQQATAADFGSYLPDDILVKVDRASMLSSLEVRAPLLDHRIISFAFARVPDRLRGTTLERKILLRRLGARWLPPALDLERKQGFSIPLSAWFKGAWGDYMTSVLRAAPPSLLSKPIVDSLLAGQRRGLANSQRLFALVMLELWRREYDVEVPS